MSFVDLAPIPTRSRAAVQPLLDRVPALSLATVSVVLLTTLIAVQAAHGFTDPDYWWHLKAGEYVVAHHAVPHADVFSATASGRAWVAHEWLSEVAIYLLVRLGGYGLALTVFTLSPALAVILLFRLLRKEQVAPPAAVLVTALSALMIALYTTVRPQVLSWLLFTILISSLYAYRARRIRALWGLPLLFLLWANLHLSFILGLGVFAIFVAGLAGQRRLARQPLRIGHPLAMLGLSILASCLNPNGPRLLWYPLSYLPLQRTVLPLVAEWKSPDFHNYVFYPLLAALLLLLVTGLSPRRLDLWALGLGLATAALALQSARYVAIFAVAFAPVAGIALSERWAWARAGAMPRPSQQRSALHWGLLAAAALVLAITFHPGGASEFRARPRTDGELLPVQAVDAIERQYPDARIFNQYEWGGYLIYRLWPRQRPFVDGRNDMFAPRFLDEYFKAFSAEPGWQKTLDRYDINLVVVRSDSSLAGALQTNPQWRLVSADNVAVVYVRARLTDLEGGA